MSDTERRLDKLYPALTARERALLALQALKEHRDEDRQVRRTMPQQQAGEFNHYIFLMNSANCELGLFVAFLNAQVELLDTRLAWLATLKLWAQSNAGLAGYINMHTKEPITQHEHEQRTRDARAEMVPPSELAEILVDGYDGWTDDDFEVDEETGERTWEKDSAWDRVQREKEREIARLVKEGVLAGKGRGKRLLANVGSFYDWLGETVPVFPDWGSGYEVLPDDQADHVEWERIARNHARECCLRAPHDIILPEPASLMARIRERFSEHTKVSSPGGDDIAAALLTRLIEGIQEHHRWLRAIDLVVAEVASEFGGEDPLVPDLRDTLDKTRHRLEDVRREVQGYVGEIEMPDPGEDELEMVRGVLEHAEKFYR